MFDVENYRTERTVFVPLCVFVIHLMFWLIAIEFVVLVVIYIYIILGVLDRFGDQGWPNNFFYFFVNFTHKSVLPRQIAIWTITVAWIQKMLKTDPHSFEKKMGICFLQLFYPITPKASNCDLTACNYFMRMKDIFFTHSSHTFHTIWAIMAKYGPTI